ncbi:MAG: FHIPEP family type III secretion protein [Treponema sp.]|nr:FHIPEP family type III secretion protein [Treponema sp.]MCL2251628.1 FHIPEP family type III secretion protein [Treponema sp.]
MPDKTLKGTLSYGAITLGLLFIVIIPIPVIFLDYLISLNLVFSLLLLIDVALSKNKEYTLFPKILLVFILFNAAINIITVRLILILGNEFDSLFSGFISFWLKFDKFKFICLAAVAVIFIIGIVIYFRLIIKIIRRVTELSLIYSTENFPFKIACFEKEYNGRIITEDDLINKKRKLKKKTDFSFSFAQVCKVVSIYEKLRIVFILINSAGGFFIATRMRGDLPEDALITFLSFAVSCGILSLIPAFLLAFSMKIVLCAHEE